MRVLTESDSLTLKKLEAKVSCRWKWEWLRLETKCEFGGSEYTFPLSRFFSKIEKAGFAKCNLCNGKEINYGKKGSHALIAHVKTKKHLDLINNVITTRSVAEEAAVEGASTERPVASSNEIDRIRETVPISVPLKERVANAEAMVLGTIAQHSLPLSIAPVLVELSQALALDKPALQKMRLSRTAATYKMVEGMGRTYSDRILSAMQQYPFSLNLDESTSVSNKKVLSVLVSYFNQKSKAVEVGHLCSLEILKCSAENLEKTLVDFFDYHEIKFYNLVSLMLDSCAVMRGSKSGLETRIRSNHCPKLLDVDGDSCHHIHNVAKKFVGPFGNYLEELFTDIHTDHQYASDQLHYLMFVCEVLEIPGTAPQRFISHRWLSAYDIALSTKRMLLAYKVLYFGFLKIGDRSLYKDELKEIFRNHHVNREARQTIKEIHEDLRRKSMTRFGQERKLRICRKIWFEGMKVELHLSIYAGVLPYLKEYVLIFQGSQTLVHKLHDKQLQVMKDYLSCFIKSEFLSRASPNQLVEMDLESEMVSPTLLYKGKVADKLCSKHPEHSVVKEFLATATIAYTTAGKYMQAKLPLNSPTLQALSAIDPLAWGHSTTVHHLQRLTSDEMLGHWVPSDCDVYGEILRYNVDSSLEQLIDSDIVDWWTSLLEMEKYPALCAVVSAALSIFHGPMVESSFSAMNDIIDVKSNRTEMLTYGAVQTTRYAIKTTGKSAIELFCRDDIKSGQVDRRLCKNLLSSAHRDKQRRKANLEAKQLQLQRLRSKAALTATEATKLAKEKESRWKRKRALELLIKSKRKRK